MLHVGIAGIGFMGMIHYLTYQKLRGVKVVAMSELEARRLRGDWRGIKGNFGPAGKQMDLRGIATYRDLDEMIADPRVDLIDVTLPPAMHADVTVRALRQGKDVFCEKPMALAPSDCKRMWNAAERSGQHLMIGHVLPFFPEYAWALKTIRSGKYGRLLGGSFRRVISDPSWLAHFWKPDKVGGPMLDLHVHDAHFIRLLFGMPERVTSQGRMRGDCAEFWHSQFQFADADLTVSATSGTVAQQGRAFDHGFEIHLEGATLMFEFAVIGGEGRYLCEPTLLGKGSRVAHPKLGDGDPMNAFEAELRQVVRSVRTGETEPALSGALARDAVLLCRKQTESIIKGRPVKVA